MVPIRETCTCGRNSSPVANALSGFNQISFCHNMLSKLRVLCTLSGWHYRGFAKTAHFLFLTRLAQRFSSSLNSWRHHFIPWDVNLLFHSHLSFLFLFVSHFPQFTLCPFSVYTVVEATADSRPAGCLLSPGSEDTFSAGHWMHLFC